MKRLFVIFLAIGLLASSIAGCAKTTDGPAAAEVPDESQVIALASDAVPDRVLGKASFSSTLVGDTWVVRCTLSQATVTADELGWAGDAEFVNRGILPEDTYRYLCFVIDAETGQILSRQALDSLVTTVPENGAQVSPACDCD